MRAKITGLCHVNFFLSHVELYHTASLAKAYCAHIRRWGWVIKESRGAALSTEQLVEESGELREPMGFARTRGLGQHEFCHGLDFPRKEVLVPRGWDSIKTQDQGWESSQGHVLSIYPL